VQHQVQQEQQTRKHPRKHGIVDASGGPGNKNSARAAGSKSVA